MEEFQRLFIVKTREDAVKEVLQKLSEVDIKEFKKACDNVGVKIFDKEGNYRDIYDVLEDLSKAFKQLEH